LLPLKLYNENIPTKCHIMLTHNF